jgi:uncharacterized protein YjgD (DUF1641 family)
MSDKILKSYESQINKLLKINEKGDNEISHELQDKLYRKFIRDIVNNKFNSIDELIYIANKMNNNVVKNDKGRWYA